MTFLLLGVMRTVMLCLLRLWLLLCGGLLLGQDSRLQSPLYIERRIFSIWNYQAEWLSIFQRNLKRTAVAQVAYVCVSIRLKQTIKRYLSANPLIVVSFLIYHPRGILEEEVLAD